MAKLHAGEVTERFLTAMRHIVAHRIGGVTTEKEFCSRLGIDQQNVSKMLPEGKPRRYATVDNLVTVVTDFGVSAGWLLTGEGLMLPGKEVDVFARLETVLERLEKRSTLS